MSQKNPENLEFNDGLGDLLREKDVKTFDIKRTLLILFIFVFVVLVVLVVTVKLGTKFLFPTTTTQPIAKVNTDALLKELEEMERLMVAQEAVASQDASEQATQVSQIPTQNPEPIKPEPVKKEPVKKESVKAEPVKQNKAITVKKEAVSKPVAQSSKKPSKSVPQNKVILGTFSERQNAKVLILELKEKGIDAFSWETVAEGRHLYAVQAGAFSTNEAAQRFAESLRKKGYSAYVLQK